MSEALANSEFLVEATELMDKLQKSQKYIVEKIDEVDDKLARIDEVEETVEGFDSRITTNTTAVDASTTTKGIVKVDGKTINVDESGVIFSFDLEQYVESKYQPVYVNGTTGDDTNDGLTPETAVKTIQQGIFLAATRSTTVDTPAAVKIFIAPGTYEENIAVRTRVFLILSGHTTIIGNLTVSGGNFCQITGDGTLTSTNCSLTIDGLIAATENSIFINDNLNIPMNVHGIIVNLSAYMYIATNTNITYDTNHPRNTAITVSNNSCFVSESTTITIDGTNFSYGIRVQQQSNLVFSTNSVLNMTKAVSVSGVEIGKGSNLTSVSPLTVRGVTGIIVNEHANITLNGASVTIIPSTGNGIQVLNNSNLTSQGTTSITISPSAAATRALHIDAHSNMNLGSCTLKVTGTFTARILAVNNVSMFYIGTGATISGSPTGQRYSATANSIILTDGGGANRIPGSTAGTVDASSVYA